MEKWILLGDFLSDKLRYEELTKLFVDYRPDCEKITFDGLESGATGNIFRYDQIATTENDLGWHVVKGRGKTCYAISAKLPKFHLCLCGNDGFDNGTTLITKYVEALYGCKEMKAKGIGITKSFFKRLPKYIKELKGKYWIPERQYDSDDCTYYEICTIDNGKFDSDMVACSSGNRYSSSNAIRPCVRLSSNTLVNIGDNYYDGSTPERALRIKI